MQKARLEKKEKPLQMTLWQNLQSLFEFVVIKQHKAAEYLEGLNNDNNVVYYYSVFIRLSLLQTNSLIAGEIR